MSIASEITRLQNAKSALATSIENKGVTVPSSATLDGYSALVDQIQTGGGTDIFDEMSNYMYVVTPNVYAFKTPYALLYNLEPGKSYKIIAKVKQAPHDYLTFFAYLGDANTPSVGLGLILKTDVLTNETTYTHSDSRTFTRIGIWASSSSDRSDVASCAIYIKKLD